MLDGPVARLSAALCSILVSGCATVDVRTHAVKTGRTERRLRLDTRAPVVTGTWQRDAGGYEGPLAWQRCEVEQRWTTAQVRVTRTAPRTDVGLVFVGAGAGLALIGGSQAVEFEDRDCAPASGSAPDRACHQETDYNPGAIAAFIVGLGLFSVGAIMVTQKRAVEAETLSRKDETARTTETCITARDVPELRLALRIGPNQLLPVQLNADGTAARIDLPSGVHLPDGTALPDGLVPATGVDLPLVVSRAPAGASDWMRPGHPIGYIRLGADPSGAAGTPKSD